MIEGLWLPLTLGLILDIMAEDNVTSSGVVVSKKKRYLSLC